MNLLELSREILIASGYKTHLPNPTADFLHFEDDALLGFVAMHADVQSILDGWRKQQDAFVKAQARFLREAPVKAWNVYSVFLTSGVCPAELWSKFVEIEEDFGSTRKVARASLITRADVLTALYPLISIQTTVTLSEADARERLRTQLELPPRAKDELLGPGSASAFADALELE